MNNFNKQHPIEIEQIRCDMKIKYKHLMKKASYEAGLAVSYYKNDELMHHAILYNPPEIYIRDYNKILVNAQYIRENKILNELSTAQELRNGEYDHDTQLLNECFNKTLMHPLVAHLCQMHIMQESFVLDMHDIDFRIICDQQYSSMKPDDDDDNDNDPPTFLGYAITRVHLYKILEKAIEFKEENIDTVHRVMDALFYKGFLTPGDVGILVNNDDITAWDSNYDPGKYFGVICNYHSLLTFNDLVRTKDEMMI